MTAIIITLLASVLLPTGGIRGSDPFMVAPQNFYGISGEAEDIGAVTSGDSLYFAVWTVCGPGGSVNIVGRRFNTSGIALDDGTISIYQTTGDIDLLDVAYGDGIFLTVWQEKETNAFAHIYGKRVDTLGNVLDEEPIDFHEIEAPQRLPHLAFGEDEFFVVWQEHEDSLWRVKGVRVTPYGEILDEPPIEFYSLPGANGFRPDVAYGGGMFLAVWEVENPDGTLDLAGSRVAPDGEIIDPWGIEVSICEGFQYRPAIAYGDSLFFAVWIDTRNGRHDIYGARISPEGFVVDEGGIPIDTGDNLRSFLRVSSGEDRYLILWQESDFDIAGKFMDREGNLLEDSLHISSSGYDFHPDLTWLDRYLIVYSHEGKLRPADHCEFKVVLGVFYEEGAHIPDLAFPLDARTYDQSHPSVVFDGYSYAVAWSSFLFGEDNPTIFLRRISPSGAFTDPYPYECRYTCDYRLNAPRLASTGSRYGIATCSWNPEDTLSRALFFNLVDPDQDYIREHPLSGQRPGRLRGDVAGRGAYYLHVWADTTWNLSIHGTLFDTLNNLLETRLYVTNVDSYPQPAVCAGDNGFLLVFRRNIEGVMNLQGKLLDPLGDTIHQGLIRITESEHNDNSPELSWGNGLYLVVYESDGNIYGVRVDTAGDVLDPDPIAICAEQGRQSLPRVDFDGVNFVVVWQDERNGNSDIYGAEVSPWGEVIDTFTVIATPGEEREPDVACGPEGQFLVVWEGWTETPHDAFRIWSRFFPDVGVAEERTQKRRDFLFPNTRRDRVEFRLDRGEFPVEIDIYDVSGRSIKKLRAERPGKLIWDLTDSVGKRVRTGIYLYLLRSPRTVRKGKIAVIEVQ